VRNADYVIKRGFFALVTIFVAITINFFLFRILPGSAVSDLSRVPHASPKLQHALTVEFGLDKPKWQQYLIYLKELFHGNMGVSFTYQQPVSHLLLADLKNTIPMVTVGTVAAILIGVFTGVLSAWRRGSAPDYVSTHTAIFFYAFPTQWLGLMLLILFAGTLPAGGMSNPFVFGTEPFWQHMGDVGIHMLLPAATLMLTAYGSYTLVVRSSMLETLGEDYVLTARAKGLPTRRIVWRSCERPATPSISSSTTRARSGRARSLRSRSIRSRSCDESTRSTFSRRWRSCSWRSRALSRGDASSTSPRTRPSRRTRGGEATDPPRQRSSS